MTNTNEPALAAGTSVLHSRHGQGTVLMSDGDTAVVRFVHGIEQVLAADLAVLKSVAQALQSEVSSSSLEVVLRVQAEIIQSVNDAWGVFTRSRISLLPHQLWVCHKVLRTWPVRVLIADDVGMGKTIEAGLILWPLMARRTVQRLLILAPAKLVEQWQSRLKRMFDIRAAIYRADLDTVRSDFWGVHQVVVASLPTLRFDSNGRHERLLDAPAWDMVIVDEAHHLNAEENSGKTLGLELLEKLNAAGKVESCVLFTGTPHRGKAFGFWSLMSLLDSDLFGPRRNEGAMLQALPRYLIRNAKQKAVDMKGRRLFMPVQQFPEVFTYSDEEETFYELLSSFILAGKAYASSLGRLEGGQVILVLIALQKLASSSIAAVLAALETRQRRLAALAAQSREELATDLGEQESEELAQAIDAWLRSERKARIQLMEDEGRHLGELIAAGRAVKSETRISRVLEVIQLRFSEEPVLLFTEYKRTQALIVSALMREFGSDSVGFMNGDNRLDAVMLPDGTSRTLSARREDVCDAFNAGRIRFLVSTEAGGEGIDLQERCSALVHVDLPWNPMRLHQRVGRLNRYGQQRPVRVVSLRNPDTVEALIWGKLEEKLNSIMRALGSAMDEPEDLMQLVLGMSGSNTFNDLFAGAVGLQKDRIADWFDQKAGTFGGESAIKTVQELVGHASSFDLSDLKEVPPLDLRDLLPFFENALFHNRRRPKVEGLSLSFRTPDEWLTSPAIKRSYENIQFDRTKGAHEGDLMGVGHPVIGKALDQATKLQGSFCIASGLEEPLLVFAVMDRVSDSTRQARRVLAGIAGWDGSMRVLRDWQVLKAVNEIDTRSETLAPAPEDSRRGPWLASASQLADRALHDLALPFERPECREIALLWPR